MKHSTKIACLYIMLLLFGSCGKDEIELEPADKPSLEISATRLDFSYISSVLSVNVITNTKDVTCGVMYGDSWCTASYSAGVLTVSVTANPDSETRSTSVTVQGDEIKKTVTVFQSGRKLNTAAVKDDIKISVKNGTDSSHQGDSDISKSFDGNMSTNYHSQWGDVDRFPITLTYNFENVTAMDYLVYYPRTSGSNGLFKEFELWIATQSEPDFKKYGDYDFAGSSSPG
ncbi:MAG: BACON domain-containing protein, partial [Prevotella sp.]|nr:BACON domain-containing protein [Prevotella sp.]